MSDTTEKTTEELIEDALKTGDSSDNAESGKEKEPSSAESESSSEKEPEDKKENGFWSRLKNSLKGDNSKEAEELRAEIEARDKANEELLKENEQLKIKNTQLEELSAKILNRVEALENKSKQAESTSKQEQIKEQILIAKKNGALKPNDTEAEKALIKMLVNDFENTVKFIGQVSNIGAGSAGEDATEKTGETYAERMAKQILNQFY